MRASALYVLLALSFTVALRSVRGEEASEAQQKHLIAFVVDGWESRLSALSIERGAEYPTVVYLKGNVEVKTPVCPLLGKRPPKACDSYMVLHADAAEFHEDTGQIEAHGNVKVVPLRHESGSRPAVRSRR
jgi:hypothetical protein